MCEGGRLQGPRGGPGVPRRSVRRPGEPYETPVDHLIEAREKCLEINWKTELFPLLRTDTGGAHLLTYDKDASDG